MPSQRFDFPGADGQRLSGRLDAPDGPAAATALFAHCFTCGKDVLAAVRIARRLAELGIATLRFDFTGLGGSGGEFANSTFTANVDDLVARRRRCAGRRRRRRSWSATAWAVRPCSRPRGGSRKRGPWRPSPPPSTRHMSCTCSPATCPPSRLPARRRWRSPGGASASAARWSRTSARSARRTASPAWAARCW